MSDLRSKALGYLRRGAVEIREIKPGSPSTPRTVMAFVQGHAERHVVDGFFYSDSEQDWECTCPKSLEPTCPHRAAVQLVTGGQTEARP